MFLINELNITATIRLLGTKVGTSTNSQILPARRSVLRNISFYLYCYLRTVPTE